ncbi:MAG: hypothetical protein ACPG38_04205 [Candidatus Pelagibacter sp.]
MEKEENLNQENTKADTSNEEIEVDKQLDDKQEEIKEVEEKVEFLSKTVDSIQYRI